MKFILGIIFSSLVGSLVALGARSFFADAPPAAEVAPVQVAQAGVPFGAQQSSPPVPPPAYSGPGFVATAIPEHVVWVDGVMMRDRKVWVYISDGRVFTEDTKGMTRVDRQGVVIDGQRIWMRRFRPKAETTVQLAAVEPSKTPLESAMGQMPVALKMADASSWRLDPDGVQRLAAPSSIGKP